MKYFFLLLVLTISIFVVNAQTVGIGTTSPNTNAILDLNSTNKGLLVPRLTTAQRTSMPAVTGMVVFDTDLKVLYHHDGSSWRQVLNNLVWTASASRSWVYNNTDSIAIGINAPNYKLHVHGGSIFVRDTRAGMNPHVIFDVPAVDYKEGGLQFIRSGTDTLAAINYVADPNYANYIRIGMSNAGTNPDLTVNSDGQVGLGTINPQGKLHIGSSSGNSIYINDSDGIIQFAEPNIGGSIDRTFIQLNSADMRLGTNSGNAAGYFIVRTNGGDRVFVDGQGDMGIGQAVPITKLHIDGGQDAGLTSNTNGYIMNGDGSGANLIIDNNEIIARNGYTGTSTLYLQTDGGEVNVGGRVTINESNEALRINGTNPYIQIFNNGVAKSFLQQTSSDFFIGVNNGRLRLDATQIAIGSVVAAASDYKLTVTGKVICEELKVKLSGSWPDYVFNKNYKLRSLPELESFIRDNNHLPNIPAAREIESSGIEVGDMQKRMMEKIEELTLYIIDLQKQIQELKNK